MPQNNNRDTAVKTVIITALTALLSILIYNVVSGGGTGIISNFYYGHRGMESGGFVTSVLAAVVKLLWLTFIISLIVGLIILIRKSVAGERRVNSSFRQNAENGYTCPCCNIRLTADFKFCPNCKASLKDICMKCGKELQAGWRCCPICGTEKRR